MPEQKYNDKLCKRQTIHKAFFCEPWNLPILTINLLKESKEPENQKKLKLKKKSSWNTQCLPKLQKKKIYLKMDKSGKDISTSTSW